MNYIKQYNLLVEKAKDRIVPDEYYEIHHIVPRSLGGNHHPHNLVNLTLKEHYVAHLLLYKIFGDTQIFSIKCFFEHSRGRHLPIKTMPRWVRRHLCIKNAELKRIH